MSIAGRSSDFGVILAVRLPIPDAGQWLGGQLVTRYSGATVQVFHLLPY